MKNIYSSRYLGTEAHKYHFDSFTISLTGSPWQRCGVGFPEQNELYVVLFYVFDGSSALKSYFFLFILVFGEGVR